MKHRTDLLILGGGPAGAALATLAADRGLDVRVLEKARFPRDKVCGEFVSAEGCAVLERLGVLESLVAAGARWMGRCRISDRAGRSLDVDLPPVAAGREALGVSRARMDLALLERATLAGAEVRTQWQARRLVIEDGRIVGVIAGPVGSTETETLRATAIVGADGRRSLIGRTLHPDLGDPRRSTPRSWLGLKTHFAMRDAHLGQRIELHLFDGGYVGLGPIEDDRINLCLMTTVATLRACGGSRDRLLRERVLANPAARAALGESKVCSPWQSVGPLRFGRRRATAGGAFLLGDAAGTVDPFCGEGMSHALMGAEQVLEHVVAAVVAGGLDELVATAWPRVWDRAFATVSRRARRIGGLFGRPRLAGPALGLLRGPGRRWAPRLVASTRTGSRA